MGVIHIEFKRDQAYMLDQLLDNLDSADWRENYADMCVYSIIKNWHVERLKVKLILKGNEQTLKFKFDAALALAFAAMIDATAIDATDYLGNKLLSVSETINRNFA